VVRAFKNSHKGPGKSQNWPALDREFAVCLGWPKKLAGLISFGQPYGYLCLTLGQIFSQLKNRKTRGIHGIQS
jgi:hypothetical protein